MALLIAAIVVGLAAVLGIVFTGNTTPPPTSDGRGCRIPHGAHAGTENPPAIIGQVTAALGAPKVTATATSGGVPVYLLCYNKISAANFSASVNELTKLGYRAHSGQDATSQLIFQRDGFHPYGITLTVTGALDAQHPAQGGHGGLALTWEDRKPSK